MNWVIGRSTTSGRSWTPGGGPTGPITRSRTRRGGERSGRDDPPIRGQLAFSWSGRDDPPVRGQLAFSWSGRDDRPVRGQLAFSWSGRDDPPVRGQLAFSRCSRV